MSDLSEGWSCASHIVSKTFKLDHSGSVPLIRFTFRFLCPMNERSAVRITRLRLKVRELTTSSSSSNWTIQEDSQGFGCCLNSFDWWDKSWASVFNLQKLVALPTWNLTSSDWAILELVQRFDCSTIPFIRLFECGRTSEGFSLTC